ncbi:uncharacterized protein slf2 isoform X2 [Clupea harengus]|uniref:Uncharacterized protein slf2 isoform X2 n=1 Tax=Clupea harengus TaxID=7950 RepID=A0A6P8GKQ7_CLUHA|nr:uncharacterized protein slf2 isoform X2 [Clupea harengus]
MADTDSHSLHANKSRITSSLKQHFISMVKDFIPLGTQRRASADSDRRSLLPKPEASSWSQAPAPAFQPPSPTCPTVLSYQKDSRRRTGPLFPRSSSQPDANMLLRSSANRLSRSSRRRAFSPPGPKRQQPSPANTRNPVWMAPSRNFRSAERKSSEASPKKGQAVHGHKMSFGTPKKDSHEASGSMIKTSTTKMETLHKMSRDGSSLQPRLVLKRLRDSDLESLGEVKRPCLNNNHQTHTQTHKPVNPGPEHTLSPPPTARPVCTPSNSTRPQTEEALISTVLAQSECELTHTSTDLTSSETNTTHTSTTTNTTEPETKSRHTSIDFAQSNRTDTSGNKSQPASKPTHTASQMAHISTNITRSSSAPLYSPTHSTPSSFPNQGHTPRPFQPRHTFSPTQPSRPTFTPTHTARGFHPILSAVPRYRHTPRPAQRAHIYTRAPGPTFLPPRHTHTPARHPSAPRNTCMPSSPVPRPYATFTLSPLNTAPRLTSSHTSLRPMFRPMQQHVSSPTHRPTNSVARHTHNYTSTNAVSRPTPTPTKPVSTLTKTPTPASPSRSTDSHTPTKPVSTLTKTPIPANTSRSTDSQTPTKPVSTLTKTPIPTNSSSRATDSHTPTKPVSTLTKTPIPTNSASRATDTHTPTKPVSAPKNTPTNPVSGPARTCRPVHPFFQSKQTHARPVRPLGPSPPPGVADAKQPRVTSSPSTAELFTPPKYVQRAFVKCNEEGPVIMKEKCSPRLPPLSEPSPSSSSSSSLLPAASVKSSSRKLFSQADSTVGPGETTESSDPQPSPLNPPQPSPIPSEADPPGSGPVQAPRSPSPQMDDLDEILTPDSLPATAGMDVDMVSPEASQDSPAHLTSQLGTLVMEPDETVTTAQTDVVLDEAGTLKAEIRTLKAEPSTNASQVCSGQDSFSRTHVPSSKASPAHSLEVLWVDPLEDDLGLGDGLSGLDCALSDTSSSEDEKLLSLQEIMERSVRPPPTPDKDAFPAPSTPVAKAPVEPIKAKSVNYKNTLEQMLIEKEKNQKSKELEEKLLQCCQENLLMMAEEEEEKEKKEEEEISHEQHKFVQKYTLTANTIRDLHPGEELFSLASFGRLFTQDSLLLPSQGISPKNAAQRSILRASPKHALLLVRAGLLKRAYASSPCQPEVSRWLLQMMSVHSDPCMSAQILQSLKHIALIAGLKIESQDLQFQVWVPSVQDVVLVFLNMGVPYISMFPLEMLQPSFTEADLLENTAIGPECAPSGSEHATFPEHNFDNVIKYLSVCAALCPRVYSDRELLLLLALVCRLSLDTHLQLLPPTNLSTLMLHLISNITDWDTQLPIVCRALTDLTEDHHNLRRLVQLLPPSSRGRQLRRHLSLSIISRLLNHRCTYKPASTEFQLSDLRRYVPRMRPSLLKHIAKRPDMEQDEATLDQQAYYLCYSLLDLTNEASNYEFLRPDQKNQLKMLSALLEKHVKCDIRESEKCLYRSKVKDYVARIYTRWHVLLQRTRPAQGKLYDFWEPLSEDALSSSQEEQQEQRRPQEVQEQRRPQPDREVEEQQEQRRPQPDREVEEQQEQRRPQPDQEVEEQQDGKENVAEEAEKMAEEEPEAAEEEMVDESSRNETVMEEVTMIEQPEEEEEEEEEEQEQEEPNREQGPSAEEGLDRVEGQLTKRDGMPIQGEELHVLEEPDRREGQPTEEGLDRVEGEPTEEQGEEMEGEGLPAEEAPAKEDKELAMEEELTKDELHQEKEALMMEMDMELHGQEEKAIESRIEVGEQSPSRREGVQAEEVEMKETGTESSEQKGPNTEEPMTEVETEAGDRSVGEGKPRLESDKKDVGCRGEEESGDGHAHLQPGQTVLSPTESPCPP